MEEKVLCASLNSIHHTQEITHLSDVDLLYFMYGAD
jgi:hypothetical protein